MSVRLAKCLCMIAFVATPLHAEHPWSELFDGRVPVAQQGDTERVELDGGVVVSRRAEEGGWAYTGTDFSGNGAAGCIALILLEIEAMNRTCPGLLDDGEQATLTSLLRTAAAFYAANAVPPISADEFLGSVGNFEVTGMECTEEIAQVAKSILSTQSASDVSAAFDVPRLPVVNPCL